MIETIERILASIILVTGLLFAAGVMLILIEANQNDRTYR